MNNKELQFTYFLLTQAFNLNTCHAIVLRHYHFSIALLLFSKKRSKTKPLSKSNEKRFLFLCLHEKQSILKGEHLTVNACM